jgi:signal transduction histidine kinase
MKNSLAVKLSLYFSAALLVLTLIIGILFILLFRNYTMEAHKKDMAARAQSIAAALSEYMSAGTSGPTGYGNGAGKGMGMGMGMGGYGVYLKFIDDIAGTPVWLVDENLNLITSAASNQNFNVSDLPADAGQVVREVFKGGTTFSEGFSSLLSTPTLTVGTPVESDGKIVGAVLLHTSVQGISESANQGIFILLISMASALALTVLMSFILASRITTPLKKMTVSTARLASGDYTVKTYIERRDEIGELAQSIDLLSDRLGEARQAAEKLDSLRRDFVSNVSHELRTPITVLRGSLEALCDRVVTEPEQVNTYCSQMLGETMVLQRLVNDLMELSRLQNTDFGIEMTRLNLYDVLSDAVRSAGQLASGKNIDIKLEADTQSLTVTGDYSRLRQMFLIVLDNAVKFSPVQSQVNVSLEKGSVSIRDHGPGIPAEDQPYIFDRFYKARSEENKAGSGLGLAIAKQIAERHGVKIGITSPPGGNAALSDGNAALSGGGTEFTFAFDI